LQTALCRPHQFRRRIAHGLYTASLISAVLGTRPSGPGAIYLAQTLNFRIAETDPAIHAIETSEPLVKPDWMMD
jgi:hypothetical protein